VSAVIDHAVDDLTLQVPRSWATVTMQCSKCCLPGPRPQPTSPPQPRKSDLEKAGQTSLPGSPSHVERSVRLGPGLLRTQRARSIAISLFCIIGNYP